MSNIKRLAIVLVVLCAVALVASSFKGSEVLQRAIIIGLGIDDADEGVSVTAEVVSPGNGTEQIGTYSKTVTAEGRSVAEAIKKIAEKTGKEASLGQCLLLILGEDYFTNKHFDDTITYFIRSDSFRESALVCCSQGKAADLMNKGEALSQSVSLSLVTKLLDQAEKVGIATNNLLKFARSQGELEKTGFLNYVKFVPSANKDTQDPDKPQGFFVYQELAIFRDYRYVCMLNEKEARGFALLQEDVVGESMVTNVTSELLTLNINKKKIDNELKDNSITISVKLYANLARTDSADESGAFSYKEKINIPQEALDDVRSQSQELVELFLKKQAGYNFDIVNLHETFRQKKGSSKELDELETKDIEVKLKLSVEEK